jgi:hypothetical protein
MIGLRPFSRKHIVWCCEHLRELEEGKWPAEDSSYTMLPGGKHVREIAGFEGAVALAAVVTQRLERCGYDGMLTYLACAFSRQEGTIAQMADMSVDELQRRTNRVVAYCSWSLTPPKQGQPKHDLSYQEWRQHRRTADKADWQGGVLGAHLQAKSVV